MGLHKSILLIISGKSVHSRYIGLCNRTQQTDYMSHPVISKPSPSGFTSFNLYLCNNDRLNIHTLWETTSHTHSIILAAQYNSPVSIYQALSSLAYCSIMHLNLAFPSRFSQAVLTSRLLTKEWIKRLWWNRWLTTMIRLHFSSVLLQYNFWPQEVTAGVMLLNSTLQYVCKEEILHQSFSNPIFSYH